MWYYLPYFRNLLISMFPIYLFRIHLCFLYIDVSYIPMFPIYLFPLSGESFVILNCTTYQSCGYQTTPSK